MGFHYFNYLIVYLNIGLAYYSFCKRSRGNLIVYFESQPFENTA